MRYYELTMYQIFKKCNNNSIFEFIIIFIVLTMSILRLFLFPLFLIKHLKQIFHRVFHSKSKFDKIKLTKTN